LGTWRVCFEAALTKPPVGQITVLLTFARTVVAKYKPSEINGTIVFLFQPAEEGGGGAKKMLEAGVMTTGGLTNIDYFVSSSLLFVRPRELNIVLHSTESILFPRCRWAWLRRNPDL
jgi:hypothetical protein